MPIANLRRFALGLDLGDRASWPSRPASHASPSRQPSPGGRRTRPSPAPKPAPGAPQERDPARRARERSWRLTSRAWATWSSTSTPGRRGVPRGPQPRPGLDPRLDQPGDRALERHAASRPRRPRKPGAEPAAEQLRRGPGAAGRRPGRDPDNPYAHFCRGIILEQQGELAEAHRALQARDRDRPQRRRPPGTGWAAR